MLDTEPDNIEAIRPTGLQMRTLTKSDTENICHQTNKQTHIPLAVVMTVQ